MPLLAVATYFTDANTSRPLTRVVIAFFDPITGVLILDPSVASVVSKAGVIDAGDVVDWNKSEALSNLSLTTIRIAMSSDENVRFADVDEARRIVQGKVTSAPPEMCSSPYLVANSGLAFPLKSSVPILMRKGDKDTLLTLTAFENYVPHKDPSFAFVMPHLLYVRPPPAWVEGDELRANVTSILQHTFSSVDEGAIEGLTFERVGEGGEEAVFRLRVAKPIAISRTPNDVLRSVR